MAEAYRSPAAAGRIRAWCEAALARWPVPPERHVIATRCGATHVVALGAGDRVCLYLPGTNFNASTSEVVLGRLASECLVYAADLPGQPGLSTDVRPDDERSGYAAWIADLVAWVRDRHPGGRIVLAGHSRGAAVALSASPDRVDGLALFSPAGLTPARPSVPMLRSTLPWLVRRNPAGAHRLLAFMSGPGHEPAAQLVEWMTLVAQCCRTTGAPGPLPDADVTRWRGHPVSVAVGDHDVFFPASRLAAVCRRQLGLDPTVVPGAGHLLVDEEPELVTTLVHHLF